MNAVPKAGRGEARQSRLAEVVADRLLEARKTVERDYAMPLTVQRLARHARLPHLTFNRAYGEAFGIAPMDHVRQLRLLEAARLLATGASVAAIASRVGYSNPNTFRAEFRRVFRDDDRLRAQLDTALQNGAGVSAVLPPVERSSPQ